MADNYTCKIRGSGEKKYCDFSKTVGSHFTRGQRIYSSIFMCLKLAKCQSGLVFGIFVVCCQNSKSLMSKQPEVLAFYFARCTIWGQYVGRKGYSYSLQVSLGALKKAGVCLSGRMEQLKHALRGFCGPAGCPWA